MTRGRSNGVNENDSASASGNKPETFDSCMKTVPLSSKTGKAEIISEGKTASFLQYNPETWMIPENVDDELSQLNLAIVSF